MGMFWKTLVAGIVAALLAGSVVYYGMPEAQSNNSVSLRTNSQNPDEPRAQKSIIDRLLKPSDTAGKTKPKPKTRAPKTQKAEAGESNDIRYYRLEDGEFTEIDALPIAASISDAVNPDASMRIMTVMEQADKIRQPDLRDRAYLDVVDYALTEDLFTPANSAMEKIKQVELRDTARARMAINLAEKGDSASAFALIDEVEVSELRDVMRLQVIEALIVPLPEDAPEQPQRR